MIIQNLGILGLGKMGSAIAAGLRAKYPELKLFAFDIHTSKAQAQPQAAPSSVQMCSSPDDLEGKCELVILSVKPQDMEQACRTFAGNKAYVSIAAGLPLDKVQKMVHCPEKGRMARVMPNISAVIGKSVSGIYSPDDAFYAIVEQVFQAAGFTIRLPKEELMHSFTALAGSGPAYVYSFLEAMAEGAVKEGLNFQDALELAAHMTIGATELLIREKSHPAVLRSAVSSPAGTTIAGLQALEEGAFHGTLMKAIEKAAARSRELSGS